jgi:hypothetical protein
MADLTLTAAQVEPLHPEDCVIRDMKAAAAITKGQAVYQTAAGLAGVADANAAGLQQFRGLALSGVATGQIVSVLIEGEVAGFDLSGMNYDAPAFLSDTAGALADAAGTLSVNVGRVVAVTDAALTKALYIKADWLRTWA